MPGAWDGFELAVRAVLGQQVTVAAGIGLVGKLVTRCGPVLAGSGLNTEGLTHVFPCPEHVASADLTTALEGKADASALADYATTEALNNALLNRVTTAELGAALDTKADTAALADYVTSTALGTALADKADVAARAD